jgi:Holliday junction resolvasome RuvABC endonuclease subunit
VSLLIEKFKPDLVAIEEIHMTRNAKSTILLGMYGGVVILAVPDNIKLDTVNAESAKKVVLKNHFSLIRKGKATKEDVFNWAVNLFDLKEFKFKSENDITDSILVAYYSMLYLNSC